MPRAADDKARRARRREEDRRRMGLSTTFNDLINLPPEPVAHLESRRAVYITMLERLADECISDPALRARICLDLLRLSSLGRTRSSIDLTATQRLDLPDLSHLSVDELQRLAAGGTTTSGNLPLTDGDSGTDSQQDAT